MKAVEFFQKPTEYAQKLKLKSERYKEKQNKKEPKIEPENELRIRDNVTQLAFAIRQANFNVANLRKMGTFNPERMQIDEQLEGLIELENFFVKSEKSVNENWIDQFNEYENFVFRFTHATPEEKERTMKFLESIQNKRK